MSYKAISIFFLSVLILSLFAGCSTPAASTQEATEAAVEPASAQPASEAEATAAEPAAAADETYAEALTINNSAWNYDTENDVYWQIGVQYCATPETTEYETLGIYIPGAYVNGADNGDGTYTITINETATHNGYTPATAPIVFPVNTGGYSAQKAPTEYSYDGISSYLEAGFIYVYAGARGRDNGYDADGNLIFSGGAPWGATDFKAAIRYIRYNQNVLPGDTEKIFVFGMSGGGAQSTVIGATGDSELYFPYLESIGAAMVDANGEIISDAVNGVMAWCPITSLDYADEAYEWNMGQYAAAGTRAEDTWTSALSKDMAVAYAEYINALGIKDENGNILVLEESDNGIYTAGNYYDYLVATIEQSLNNFLADTTFPYTETAGGFMRPDGGFPGGDMPDGARPQGAVPGRDATSTEITATTYETAQEYIDALNNDGQWVTYDATSNTAKITSLAGFVNSQKNPSKSVGAFDDLERSQAENNVFGNDESENLHFDVVLANLLSANQAEYAQYSDWDAAYIDAYATDLQSLDKFDNSIQYRMNSYNPMYYLLPYYEGYQTSTVAQYWRIRTGITQGDTATTVEMNLALALEKYDGVESVDFATVWGQGHTMAERTGDSTGNFIAWVNAIAQK